MDRRRFFAAGAAAAAAGLIPAASQPKPTGKHKWAVTFLHGARGLEQGSLRDEIEARDEKYIKEHFALAVDRWDNKDGVTVGPTPPIAHVTARSVEEVLEKLPLTSKKFEISEWAPDRVWVVFAFGWTGTEILITKMD